MLTAKLSPLGDEPTGSCAVLVAPVAWQSVRLRAMLLPQRPPLVGVRLVKKAAVEFTDDTAL